MFLAKELIRYVITISLSWTAFGLVGCDKSTPDDLDPVPVLSFACDIGMAPECIESNEGHNVYIGLEENSATNCESQLSFYNFEDGASPFEYWSMATATASGGRLVGTASRWVNSQAMPVSYMQKQSYKVCAFLDLNDNGKLDTFEPVHSSNYGAGTNFLPLSNWSTH